jgi:hypothetical protein
MNINKNRIIFGSKRLNKTLNYNDIKEFTVRNYTNYANIIIDTKFGIYKFNIGRANLKLRNITKPFKIVDSFNELDSVFSENNFEKIINNVKGTVKYVNQKY